MGTYLTSGIVKEIVIEKASIKNEAVALEEIVRQLGKEVNVNCYNYTEDIDAYRWNLKPEMFDGSFIDFLDTQFQMYCDEKDRHMQDVLEQLTKTKTAEAMIKLASNKGLVRFQLLDDITEYIKVVGDNGFGIDIPVYYRLISYFLNGKIIMECYGKVLRYFEQNIRLQRDKYPIADCVKVMITG